MVSFELMSTLGERDRADKLYIMQVLVSDLAQQETPLLQPEQAYPVWSPHGADEAANTLLQMLKERS